jgi:signal transduction histidine kinase
MGAEKLGEGDLAQRIEIKTGDEIETLADRFNLMASRIQQSHETLEAKVGERTREVTETLQQQTATADVLKVISRSAFDVKSVLRTLAQSATELCAAQACVVYLREGDLFRFEEQFGAPADAVEFMRDHPLPPGRDTVVGRAALLGSIVNVSDRSAEPEIQLQVPGMDLRAMLAVPLLREGAVFGVFTVARTEAGPFTGRQVELIQTFADQAVIAIENVRLFEQVEARTHELARSLDDLRSAQDRLIQTEKLASLGQFTAGVAHEIKNPLNFVNNFAELSRDLLNELNEIIGQTGLALGEEVSAEIGELTGMIKSNLDKVVQHGRRADSIVKNMLLHSREGGGERRSIDLNSAVEESMNLAFHGARAERPDFNITLAKDLDPAVGAVDLYPQEFTRVLLNLISNGFYAAHRKKIDGGGDTFEPSLAVSTRALPDRVEIRIRDNGTGIPDEVKEKIFNPFFTTKPAGEGTGLGLSLCHDIVVKQHGGTINVDTKLGEFTEFTIFLPRASLVIGSSGDQK